MSCWGLHGDRHKGAAVDYDGITRRAGPAKGRTGHTRR